MAIEIERKFLVHAEKWRVTAKGEGTHYQQGYLLIHPEKTVRVRMGSNESFLTIKGETKGLSRPEYEYRIPNEDAAALLRSFCEAVIEKVRYRVLVGEKVWEVDEFCGLNEGLVLAEIELASEAETFNLPDWAADEVTGDKRYYNSYLAHHPFSSWNVTKPN